MKALIPPDEAQRLEALRQYEVLDTAPEASFDDLTLLAAHICQTPIALVSLVDEHRQWFKSKIGVTVAETSRDMAFCAHTILHKDEVLEVRDAEADPRFADSELVTSDPHIRFYAGAPLVAQDGQALGALCVMDRTPRKLTDEQLAALRALSRQVVAQLELKRQAGQLAMQMDERKRAEALLRERVDELSKNKVEADRLLILAQKSRRALLSVIEDEKLAGQKLRETEERFRELAENINEVFWITDPAKSKMLYISPAYEKVWGRTCESLYADPNTWLEAIHPEDHDRVMQSVRLNQPAGTYEEEYRVVRPDKSIRWIRDKAFTVRNQAGQVQRFVGVARDITENRELESQFRQAQKMESFGQLAGGVAHDFNNILAAVQLQIGLLADEPLTPEQLEYVGDVKEATQRAANLTRQLLLFSRKQTMQASDLDLKELVANVAKMLQRIVNEDIRVEFKFSAQPLLIHADGGMIDQIVLNLVVNARDAMLKGGRVTIETSAVDFNEVIASQTSSARCGAFACLSVTDTGSGISREILPRIFEPFFTTKDVGKGTGLGLATVFGIVQQHLGWINVDSEVGKGTTFKVYLPRLERRPGDRNPGAALAPARGGTETILLVEDDATLRISVTIALKRRGYRILAAENGAQALEIWKEYHTEIRLLLTDLIMPGGINGKELAERLLREEPRLKVIYASGYSGEIAGKNFRLEEGVNFLAKPFEGYKLAQTVRNCLD